MAGQGVRSTDGVRSTLPTIVFHGDAGRTVNPVNADHVITQAKPTERLRNEVNRGEIWGVADTHAVQRDDEGRAILEQWTLHAAGHVWSGGSANGSYAEPRGPHASREIARFFLSYQKAKAQRS
jgi:poly(3-hydroxybutyrate) depolymerase